MSDIGGRTGVKKEGSPEDVDQVQSLAAESLEGLESAQENFHQLGGALWRTAQVDSQEAEQLAHHLQVPLRVARWLCTRTGSHEEAEDWLQPLGTISVLPWSLFHGLPAAALRIWAAVTGGERICIVGDYDVDGVTASAILASSLEAMGADWQCIIPHRTEDGYGLSEDLAQRAAQAGAKLLVTVDNGIHAGPAVTHATQLGMDVIITDHHQPGPELSKDACAIVHWADADRVDEVSRLSGAGVARKLADALLATAGAKGQTAAATRLEALSTWHDALASLGTLADMMSMRGENRRLVRAGIEALRVTQRPGWLALCAQADVNPMTLTESSILWSVTPRLNAAGRMGSAEVAFRLLMADNATDAETGSQQVESWNRLRREVTEGVAREATTVCEQRFGNQFPAGLVVAGPWPLGVVGIVAARLCNDYHRPVIVLADDRSGHLRGSGRAPTGFPLYDTVGRCAEYLDHFGGHEAAIGCALASEQLEDFCAAFADHAAGWNESQRTAALELAGGPLRVALVEPVADDYLPLSEATISTLDWVAKLGPFGPDNPPLSFYVGPLQVVSVKAMGQNKQHLRIQVRELGATAELVWFQARLDAREWHAGTRIAGVVQLEDNTWRGVRRAQLRVLSAQTLASTTVDREAFSQVYRLLRARRRLHVRDAQDTLEMKMDIKRLRLILNTFVELGFARCEESAYHVVDGVTPSDLRESANYQQHLAQAWLNP